jgi:phytoene synthase
MIDGHLALLDRPTVEIAEAVGWADQAAGSAAVLAARTLDAAAPAEAARIPARLWGLAILARRGRLDARLAAEQIAADLPIARRAAGRLSVAAFPAVAHAALAKSLVAGDPGGLSRRLHLLWAVGRGRL